VPTMPEMVPASRPTAQTNMNDNECSSVLRVSGREIQHDSLRAVTC
jgi:hypothetical protein